MKCKLFIKITVFWILFIPIAIFNGILRTNWYGNYMSELLAHQISTVIAILLFVTLAFIFLKIFFIDLQAKEIFLIGLYWVLLTICFEFLFGYFLIGHTLKYLVTDYNIFKGRIWSLFLVSVLFTPWFISKYYEA